MMTNEEHMQYKYPLAQGERRHQFSSQHDSPDLIEVTIILVPPFFHSIIPYSQLNLQFTNNFFIIYTIIIIHVHIAMKREVQCLVLHFWECMHMNNMQ